MIASPNRVLARVVLTAVAIAGSLMLVALELLLLSTGQVEPTNLDLRCLIAPVSSMDAALHASAVALGLVAALPILMGMRTASQTRANLAELRQAANVARLIPPPRVVAAASVANISGRVDVVDVPRPLAFAYGWIWQRVCISTGLLQLLDDYELHAVLLHEGWHVSRRDPLRLLLAQSAGAAFAIVPEIRRLVRHYILAVEVAADRHVVAVMGDRRWLASALVKIMSPPVTRRAFEGDAEGRIAALTGRAPADLRWRGRIAVAALILELAVLVPLLSNGSIMSIVGLWIHPVC